MIRVLSAEVFLVVESVQHLGKTIQSGGAGSNLNSFVCILVCYEKFSLDI